MQTEYKAIVKRINKCFVSCDLATNTHSVDINSLTNLAFKS